MRSGALLASLVGTMLFACQATDRSIDTADGPLASWIVSGGSVLSLDPDLSVFDAVALAEGRIIGLGSRQEMEKMRGPATEDLDLAGRVLLPSFVDHHVHLLNMGMSLQWSAVAPEHFVDLAGATSEAEIGARLKERAAALPNGAWIIGQGWSQGAWGSGALPDHRVLSAAVPDHPVYLTRVDGHAGWLNSRAMQEAGLDRSTVDPQGGSIRRFANGDPTGVLMERANECVTTMYPPPGDEEIMGAFRRATEVLAEQGVTEVFDAGFLAVPGIVDLGFAFDRYLDLLIRTDRESPLPVRVNLMIPAPSELARRVTEDPTFERDLSPRLRVTHLKLFMDGAMGSRGALLSHPYADDPSTHGVRRMTPSEMRQEVRLALDSGLDVATHVIGDQAVSDALDIYEEILASRTDILPGRMRLEHFSYAREEDFHRAASLGIVLSVQPNFVFPDDEGEAMEDARVGTAYSNRVYAWGRLRDLGARLAFGSDYFTKPLSPLYTFYAATTRKNPTGRPERGWHPDERLERLEALRWATSLQQPGGVRAERSGLAVGNTADLVVLSANPLLVEEDRILEIAIEGTFLAGSPTYSKSSAE